MILNNCKGKSVKLRITVSKALLFFKKIFFFLNYLDKIFLKHHICFHKVFFLAILFSVVPLFDIFAIPEIYVLSENNFIATAICDAIDAGMVLMVPLFAIAFTVIGYSAFNGQLNLKVFVTFGISIAIFKGSGTLLNIFIPHVGLNFGCKCATHKYIRDVNGVVNKMPTGLDEGCNEIVVSNV